jgi:hypothetical protein
MSDKRYEGEIISWNSERNFGFIEYDAGCRNRIFYSGRNIRCDWKGSRAWAFDLRIPVSFTISRNAHKNQTKHHADDVAPVFPMSEPENLAGYRETSEMVSKTYDYGFLKRPCGDLIFIHKHDVADRHKDRWGLLETGSPVYHGARFDEATQRWRADYVELYSYEELQSFKDEESQVEPEPEAEPVLVAAEPVLALAPENRSKTFLQLVLQKRARHALSPKIESEP